MPLQLDNWYVKRKSSHHKFVEYRAKKIVKELNSLPFLVTVASCGGHEERFGDYTSREFEQNKSLRAGGIEAWVAFYAVEGQKKECDTFFGSFKEHQGEGFRVYKLNKKNPRKIYIVGEYEFMVIGDGPSPKSAMSSLRFGLEYTLEQIKIVSQ